MIPMGPPAAGTEAETLIGALERQRRTFAWKTGGLDATGLRATAAASTMTLGGLLKHLALCEDMYFSIRLGHQPAALWKDVDWDAEPDWEWRTAADDSPEFLYALWAECAARSRANITAALSEGGLDHPLDFTWPDGQTPSLRRALIDMIEEYARHTGHADLIREAIDGLTGEDPPE
ncbi:DinB family protein [Actinoplanes sp. NEAU-A12]|uniref:DinB family protein n=1 Tax=Actinoplanes sandaracinus TaxID=3045177 RepID=A0ABT6WQ48_9ACTN|nr:DinB family protein [Actinoplanes sandaracinus]MDI6101804.1 DinB family protein [Actinoplanes sandaracinus]